MYDHADFDAAFVRRRVAQFRDQVARRIDGSLTEEEFRPLRLMNGLYLQLHAYMLRPTVILVGDITFYHDMNGLLAVRQQQLRRVTVVLLNNNGGGIFRRLPIAGHEPPFTELFLTPHGLDFAPAGQLYGLAYQRITSRAAFRRHLAASLAGHTPTLLEAQTDGAADLGCLREVVG